MNIGLFSFTLRWNLSFPFTISAASIDVVVTDFGTKRERPRGSAWENTAERDLNHMLSASVSLVFPSHICSSFSARMHAEHKVSALLNPLGGRLQTTALHCIKSRDRVVDKLGADEGVFCTNEQARNITMPVVFPVIWYSTKCPEDCCEDKSKTKNH